MNKKLIADNICNAFGYDGYKGSNLYRNDLGHSLWHPELTVKVPEGITNNEITFYRKNKAFKNRTPYDWGIAREYNNFIILIIQGGVIGIEKGKKVFEEIL